MKNCFFTILLLSFPCALIAQKGVLTQHNDLNRTGWNKGEKILNVKNVKPGSFGMLFSRAVDDQIYAQPLVIPEVIIQGNKKNVVIVCTVNNTVYAFDADSSNVVAPYWQVSLTSSGGRAVVNTDMTGACGGGYRDFSGKMGIVGTPVIDSATSTLYVVSRSVSNTGHTFQQHLHALDIRTGAEMQNSPQLITASVAGSGDGNVNGNVFFDAQKENQRCGLLLLNGIVYITYASHCDWGPYHGWILGYDKNSLAQKIIYNTTPDGYNGGIWMSGAAPSADENGNIYVAVGNGSIGKNNNFSDVTNRSESAIKLIPAGGTLVVSTFFTPLNIQALEASDLDFGVTEILLIPGTNRAMTGCKDGKLYLVNRDQMGGFSATINNVIQTIDLGNNSHLRSSLGYYKGQQKEFVYSWSENALLKAFPYNRTSNQFDLNNTLSSGVQGPTGNNGALLAVSSYNSVDTTAILWASYAANGDANQSVRPGILRAFAASDISKELWNSSQSAGDVPGSYAKFVCPTIVNGKVYLATFSNKLVVYGLTNLSTDQCNSSNTSINKVAIASSIESPATPASAAFDGNLSTRWSSLYTDPQSIYVDLGARHNLCRVVLHWENALAKDYQVQVSDNATNWKTVISITGNTDLDNYLSIQDSGRYVRMYGTARGTQYGYSLYEFEVYGKPSSNSCAPPSGALATNIYGSSVNLQWEGSSATSFMVQYKTVSAGNWTSTPSSTNSIALTGLACSTDYLFQIQALCDQTHSSNYSASAAFSTLPCSTNCNPLPTRWTTQDVGDVAIAGSGCFDAGVFELHGSGDDIWNTQDAFRFSYKTLVGDGEIRARVLSVDQSDPWNKTGIMFRETLTSGSRNSFIALTSGNGVAFQNRSTSDGNAIQEKSLPGLTAPYWIKLVKKGSLYTAFHSENGITWIQTGNPVNVGFGVGVPVYAGLAVCSHNNGVLSTSTIDNYLFSGVLDIELQSFTASLNLNKSITLQWVTTLETDIKEFVVERSDDNMKYADLDTTQALSTGKFTHTYSYIDNTPLPIANYYRLRIEDNSGVISYSAPVSVSLVTGMSPSITQLNPSVYPNPSQSGLIRIRQGQFPIRTIRIFDNSGKTVVSLNASSEITDIPVSAIANGIYFVEIRTANALYSDKVIIRN